MRLAVTGLSGQVVSALIERAARAARGRGRCTRPPPTRSVSPSLFLATLRALKCDTIINAAAHSAVA